MSKKITVQSQEYKSCYPFVCVLEHLIFPFDLGISILNFPRSSVFFGFYFIHVIYPINLEIKNSSESKSSVSLRWTTSNQII